MKYISALLLCFSVISPAYSAGPGSLPDIDYGEGARVIYLDFWASWCVPCRKSFPWLNEMQERYGKDGFVVVGINEDENQKMADKFLELYPAEFAIVADTLGSLAQDWEVQGMPMAVLVDAQGNELSRHIGFFESKKQQYEQIIIQHLEEKQ